MLSRFRSVLVSSYVGTVALGWVFSQAILHFAYIFSAPIASWLTRREYRGVADRVYAGFSLHDSLPELPSSFHSCSLDMFCCAGFITSRQTLERGFPTASRRGS